MGNNFGMIPRGTRDATGEDLVPFDPNAGIRPRAPRRSKEEIEKEQKVAATRKKAKKRFELAKLTREKVPPRAVPAVSEEKLFRENERLSMAVEDLEGKLGKAMSDKEAAATAKKIINTADSAKEAKSELENEFQNSGIDMKSLMSIAPALFLMYQNGGTGGGGGDDISEREERAKASVEKMETMITDLKELREEIKKNKKATESIKEEERITTADVSEALKVCKAKNKKYKAYLEDIQKYSDRLDEKASKILAVVDKNTTKAKKKEPKKKPKPNNKNDSRKKNPKKGKK